MEIVYKSIDNKYFESEKDCERHEKSLLLNKINGKVLFYDFEGNLMDISEDLYDAYNSAQKIIIPTKEDYNNLAEVYNFFGYYLNNITSEGIWYYVNDEEISEEEFLKRIKDMNTLYNAGRQEGKN